MAGCRQNLPPSHEFFMCQALLALRAHRTQLLHWLPATLAQKLLCLALKAVLHFGANLCIMVAACDTSNETSPELVALQALPAIILSLACHLRRRRREQTS